MPLCSPSEENTCAIIVTYHPDDSFPIRFRETSKQFPQAVIVDNGSNDRAICMLKNLAAHNKVKLITNAANIGVAAALNQAIKFASSRRFEWIVTFDQDTAIFPDLLTTLAHVHGECADERTLIGANYWNANKRRFFLDCRADSVGFQRRKTLITSGMLISLQTFLDIGLFREDYFIDSVDHEFCLRARRFGYQILMSCKPGMTQTIGNTELKETWLRPHMSFNHVPSRKYYIARNSVMTIRIYFRQEPLWSMFQILRLIGDIGSILLYEPEKSKKLRAFARGVRHGVRGKMGPIEVAWPNGF